MKSLKVESPSPSIVSWLDRVQMSKPHRKIAQEYLRKTEALVDVLWFAGAGIRGLFVHRPADRKPAGTGLSGQARNAAHRA
ncbi:MAG TPA: hypothetical protein VIW78_08655 [Burkholderiales bacterium]